MTTRKRKSQDVMFDSQTNKSFGPVFVNNSAIKIHRIFLNKLVNWKIRWIYLRAVNELTIKQNGSFFNWKLLL